VSDASEQAESADGGGQNRRRSPEPGSDAASNRTRRGRASRDHPIARAVVAEWRRLTGGHGVRDADRPTLIACSAGVDSSGLAIALAGVRPAPVIAHVIHDLRQRADAVADHDAARALAQTLGLDFATAEVPVRAAGGNLEATARRGRYDALADLARTHGCRFVATAHHADDQLETVLMRLIRGSGPRGLGGIRAVRSLGDVSVVRPMLGMNRSDAVRICRDAGWAWKEDASNRDESFLRNAIRARVIPEIKAIRPDAAERAAVTAEVCTMAADAIEREARLALNAATREVGGRALLLGRKELAATPLAVRCETLRIVLRDHGGSGMDRAGWKVLGPAARAIGDGRTEPRSFRVGSIVLQVTAHEVRVASAKTEKTGG
tara:strand:+ start:20737 stop:21870 length:1134 start_codon:yes stop_codon:yes gene_type:complete